MDLLPLALDQLQYRLDEEADLDADWFVDHMKDVTAFHSEGCFTLYDEDRPVGMITSTPYQAVGWLGWLYVKESHRGAGLGAGLMKAGIDYLRKVGMKTIVQEAVVEAVSLYKRLGFVEQFQTQHYLLSPGGSAFKKAEDVAVSALGREQLDLIAPFDLCFFGQDRHRMLEIAMANKRFEGYLAHAGTG